eukprot:1052800-Pyramimonas_sp.AAC.1
MANVQVLEETVVPVFEVLPDGTSADPNVGYPDDATNTGGRESEGGVDPATGAVGGSTSTSSGDQNGVPVGSGGVINTPPLSAPTTAGAIEFGNEREPTDFTNVAS